MLLPTGQNTGSQDGARASGVPRRRNTEREIFLTLQLTLIRAVPSEGILFGSQRGEAACVEQLPKNYQVEPHRARIGLLPNKIARHAGKSSLGI